MSELIIEQLENFSLSSESRPKQLFSKVGIVGGGSVGQEIALLIAEKEVEVVFLELSYQLIDSAIGKIERILDHRIDHWGMTPGEKRAIMSRISGYVGYEHLKGCDLVIEAVRSDARDRRVSYRKEIFKNIEQQVSSNCIICTNSSTLVITELSAELENKQRCISLHFLTNAPNAEVIEVVRGLYTSNEVYEKVFQFIRMLDMEPIACEESPGLISIRIFAAQLNEACSVLMEGVASLEDIDKTMRTGMGQTLGPFEMADKIGLDKVLRWMENLYSEFGDTKYKASPVIKRRVRAQQLGRMTGKGFYCYDEEGNKLSVNITHGNC
jgi:3-hydroxybutyryl-CoA dehydrogenase